MNRKTFFGALFGLGFLNTLQAAVKEKVGRVVKDYVNDTIQVRRVEIVDDKGVVCGFIEEREGKMVLGVPKKEEPKQSVQEVQLKGDFYYKSKLVYQEPSPCITQID